MTSDDLLARVSHLYYVLGLTQQSVAERLGITRVKAQRLLAEARERGIVQIRINAPSAARLELEAGLRERYGLEFVSIAPSDCTPELELSKVIGIYAAQAVRPLLHDDMTVAIAWGVTLKSLAVALEPAPLRDVAVVPLLGSLSRRSSIDEFEATTVLAQKLGGECYYLPSPIICDSAEAKQTILQQPMAREVMRRAEAADLALLSVGGRRSRTLRRMSYLTDAEFDEVVAKGAIGNFLGRFLDDQAEVIDHPVNERVVGLSPAESLHIPARVMVSGGATKAPVLERLLERGYATGIVTDEATARLLLG